MTPAIIFLKRLTLLVVITFSVVLAIRFIYQPIWGERFINPEILAFPFFSVGFASVVILTLSVTTRWMRSFLPASSSEHQKIPINQKWIWILLVGIFLINSWSVIRSIASYLGSLKPSPIDLRVIQRPTVLPTKTISPPTLTPTSFPLPEEELISPGWKIFRNFIGGYSIQFPESWFIRDKPKSPDGTLAISNKSERRFDEYIGADEVYVSIKRNDFHAPAKLFEIQIGDKFEQNYFIYSKLGDFVVNGYPAVKYNIRISPNHPGTEWRDPEAVYAIKHDGTVFLFDPLTLNKVIFDQYAQVIQEIVSSFRAL